MHRLCFANINRNDSLNVFFFVKRSDCLNVSLYKSVDSWNIGKPCLKINAINNSDDWTKFQKLNKSNVEDRNLWTKLVQKAYWMTNYCNWDGNNVPAPIKTLQKLHLKPIPCLTYTHQQQSSPSRFHSNQHYVAHKKKEWEGHERN